MSEPQAKPPEPDTPASGIDQDLDLADDHAFESRWWRIEIAVWTFLTLCLLCGLSGIFGRGPLANREVDSADGALQIRYERVARYQTPAVMQIRIHPQLYRDGKAYLWVNRTLIEDMGSQRIIPQPQTTTPGADGMAYIFPVEDASRPISISFALQPGTPGIFEQEVRTDPGHDLFLKSITLP